MKNKFWTDLWWLLVFCFLGAVVTLLLSSCMSSIRPFVVVLHLTQWMQTLLMELLPVVLWVKLYKKEHVREVLYLHWPGWRTMGLVVLLMAVSLPMMEVVENWCLDMPLPSAIEQWSREALATQEVLVGQMLSVSGVGGWLELVMLMCVATAVAEEWTFRGALLRCFGKNLPSTRGRRLWVAVVIGLIFSAIHGDVYGLLPRWALGILFVYLLYWSGSIWPGVLAHALNNLMAVIGQKEAPVFLEEPGAMWTLLSAVAAVGVLLLLYREGKQRAAMSGAVGTGDCVGADRE